MTHDACPLPDSHVPDAVPQLLRAKRIAVVGLSDDPARPSHYVAQYLLDHGKEVIPVNPAHPTLLGLTSYPSLESVPGHLDLVDVFRRPPFCPAIVESAIAIHAGGVWLQAGIVSPEAQRLAADAGLPFVQNRCLMVDHARLSRAAP